MAVDRGARSVNIHLDTHVAVWIAAGQKRKLRAVEATLRRGTMFISPLVIVELELLREIGRIHQPVDRVLEILMSDHGISEAAGDVGAVAHQARLLGWTRDPFDRFIVAHALACRATLLTADETIRKHCSQALWQ